MFVCRYVQYYMRLNSNHFAFVSADARFITPENNILTL